MWQLAMRKETLLYEEEGICAVRKENLYFVEITEDLRCVARRKANNLWRENEGMWPMW